jgi:hypothetical protein
LEAVHAVIEIRHREGARAQTLVRVVAESRAVLEALEVDGASNVRVVAKRRLDELGERGARGLWRDEKLEAGIRDERIGTRRSHVVLRRPRESHSLATFEGPLRECRVFGKVSGLADARLSVETAVNAEGALLRELASFWPRVGKAFFGFIRLDTATVVRAVEPGMTLDDSHKTKETNRGTHPEARAVKIKRK